MRRHVYSEWHVMTVEDDDGDLDWSIEHLETCSLEEAELDEDGLIWLVSYDCHMEDEVGNVSLAGMMITEPGRYRIRHHAWETYFGDWDAEMEVERQ